MGLVSSISNGGSVTFVDYDNVIKVFRALPRHYNKVAKTVISLWVSNCDLLLPNTKMSLVSSSSCNYLISTLVAAKST
jgi:hypothetical protein